MSERIWNDPIHVEAGYHEQEWGAIPTADDPIIGTYAIVDGGLAATLTVSLLEEGVTGNPELLLQWSNGRAVTVVDGETAELYLADYGATRIAEAE